MHQKKIIGSHYANFLDCRHANAMILKDKVQIINDNTYSYNDFSMAHQDLADGKIVGNGSVLVLPNDVRGLKNRAEIEEKFK